MGRSQQRAFEALKSELSNIPILGYHIVKDRVAVTADWKESSFKYKRKAQQLLQMGTRRVFIANADTDREKTENWRKYGQ